MSNLPQERFSSFSEFWPYYLSEHSVASCRHVHFIGTNGFVAYLIYLSSESSYVLIAFIAALIIGKLAFASEAKRNASWALFLMIGLMTWVEPRFIYGVLFAYFFAWVGHFLIEHNRPATFQYTLWSLTGDFKMCAQMWRGHLWRQSANSDVQINIEGKS
ncbi:MAG: hypothetical protein CMH49_02750 [Myxococcales bacterium]|nr:hypothetical protein [Myxococcales bacterium]